MWMNRLIVRELRLSYFVTNSMVTGEIFIFKKEEIFFRMNTVVVLFEFYWRSFSVGLHKQ